MTAIRVLADDFVTAEESFEMLDTCAQCAKDALLNGTKEFHQTQDGELCEILARASRADPYDQIDEWSFVQGQGYRCREFVPLQREVAVLRLSLIHI